MPFGHKTGTIGGRKREKRGTFIPAHTVVGGFGHSYCQGQVNTGKRYGKIVFHCALENPKLCRKVSLFL